MKKIFTAVGSAMLLILLLVLAGAVYQFISTRTDQRKFPPPGESVNIGGFSLHIYCTGENVNGRPTVILEQGLGGTSAAWVRVQPEISRTTRVCAYDRAGMGWSDLSPEPRDAEHITAELHGLLHKAGVAAPYILVGWSYGGLYVRKFADQYPDEVAGLVLLDASHPDQWSGTPAGQAQYKINSRQYTMAPLLARLGVMRIMGLFQADLGLPDPQNGAIKAFFAATKDWDAQSAEFLASPATNEQVSNLTSLAHIPLIVLTATEHGFPPEMEQLWLEFQNELTSLSTNSIHQIVAGAGHSDFWLDVETSSRSVTAVLQVVEAAHTGIQLQP